MPANLPLFSDLPFYNIGAGISTSIGTIIPPGVRVTYVGTQSSGMPQTIADRLAPTLQAGLNECRSGAGDIVFVLPGYTENVSATSFTSVAGARVIGLGDINRDDAPTLTWNATGSTWAVSAKNMEFRGLRLMLGGANGVTKAINITGAGTRLVGNYISMATGAALKATIGVEVGSAATDCVIASNLVQGTATHNVTDGFKVVGATTPDRLAITGNKMLFSATAGNGLIHVTVAALNLLIENNLLYNTHTSSTATIALDDVACDGILQYNMNAVKSAAGAPAAEGIVFAGTSPLVLCYENRTVTAKQTTGIVCPANDA